MVEKIKKGERILLTGKKSFLVEASKDFHSQFGVIKVGDLVGKKFGTKIKAAQGEEFFALRPNLIDFLHKRLERMPQIISLKDCALIAAYTGLSPSYRVADGGTGSAFLALFMANIVRPGGKIYTYELRKDFFDIAKKNIDESGLNAWVEIKNQDMMKIKEKELDLITLDMPNAEKMVHITEKALKPGGFLAVYSPYIEQMQAVLKALEQSSLLHVKTFEAHVREYQGESGFTRPKTMGINFTGYITIARKIKN